MIKRDSIERLPTVVREDIKQYLQNRITQAREVRKSASMNYVITTDEKFRSDALISQGEFEAFLSMYNMFK